MRPVFLINTAFNDLFLLPSSALCLRLFGEDFTPFGIELQAKKRQTRTLSTAPPVTATIDPAEAIGTDGAAIVVDPEIASSIAS